jgi:predicted MPP superfamily phosphohydrolase
MGLMRVCVVGDLHVSPGQNLSRLDWIRAHIRKTKPDATVLIGDVCSFDSVSMHDPLGSVSAKHQPTIAEDMAVLEAALDRLGKLPGRLFVCLGNHEERIQRYEETDARLKGTLWPQLLNTFKASGYRVTDYGEFLNLKGVRFTHIPLNIMRKPYPSIQTIVRDLKFDLCYGHSHEANILTGKKIGGGVTAFNVPCSLPQGYVEKYALKTTTSWAWGISDLELADGKIGGYARHSMDWLKRTYG